MTDRELMQMALDWADEHLRVIYGMGGATTVSRMTEWTAVFRARLAQPKPEPVAWIGFNERGECREVFTRDMKKLWPNYSTQDMTPVYTAPPQREYTAWNIKYNREPLPSDNPHEVVAVAKREWQGMTDEDIRKLSDDCAGVRDETEFIRAIEAKLKEKNGY